MTHRWPLQSACRSSSEVRRGHKVRKNARRRRRFRNAVRFDRQPRQELDSRRDRCSRSPIRISSSRISSPTTSTAASSAIGPTSTGIVDLNGARTRKQYTLWDRRVEAGDPERTALWRTVSDAVSAPEIEAALRERLRKRAQDPPEGSGEPWPVPMYPQPVLYADFDGYAIKPHPDTRRKVLTDHDLHARGREPARTRHHRLQDLADGRLRLEDLRPRQGKDRRRSCPTPASPSSSSTRRTASCTRAGTAARRSRSTTPSRA